MYSSRSEIVESQDAQKSKFGSKNRNGQQVKRRNVSNGQNMAGGSKRRFQYQNNNKFAAGTGDTGERQDRQNGQNYQQARHQSDLSPVIEITVSDENKRENHAGNAGLTPADDMHTTKFHRPHYGRTQYRPQYRAPAEHKWHCSGWGACTCGFQKPQWTSRDYQNSRSPSLRSESPPMDQLMATDTRTGYESDSSHSSHQHHVPAPFEYVVDLPTYQRYLASSQSSLSSSDTYELLPYLSPRGSYSFLYTEPLLNHDMDGFLRKGFSPPDSRRVTIRRKRTVDQTPPDHFIARAHLVMIKKVPQALLTGGQWDELSQMVWNRFMSAQQTEETYVRKMNLWKSLFVYIRSEYPRYGLYLVGSTMTGFGSDTSDVDMCLVSRNRTELEPRLEAIVNLTELQNFLALNKKYEMFHLIEAKVPILRFSDAESHIEVDLNYNNCVGIRNTQLLYSYSNMDWRVRPLVLVVKMWARYHCINNAKNSTISSYSLALMVIHFLQVGVSPAILPCLHDMYPEKFSMDIDIRSININEQLKPYHSRNHQTLGELFLQFLGYYSNFNYSQFAISVRTASCLSIDFCRMQRSPKNSAHQWKHLCIEEPFDLTNTARSVYDSEVFEKIKYIFLYSWRTLEATMDLNAIFKPIYGYPYHTTPSC